ncbi:CTP synthase C-terminal region-related (seleno)protein [Serratia ficaria]|nr:CTP synthase [Serratia ficaria]CAI2098185.1 CTP synthase [Serratia ficaria]CAI2469927.1 CTP synthase [Serratia ficaria]CAI2483532.1 CTP synthase [Serratia ficaria]
MMKDQVRIALVGDYKPQAIAHQAIPVALQLTAAHLDIDIQSHWLPTETLTSPSALQGYDAIWVVPGSPYNHDAGAFMAIRHAREQRVPFLGSCGGFQYAVVEYARNVMGWHDAGHAETDSGGRLVIAPLSCSLVEKSGGVLFQPNTRAARAYGRLDTVEGYHCNFGVNPEFVADLQRYPLIVSAHDLEGEVRAVELPDHPFYVATLFQSERAALRNALSPLVVELIRTAASR